MQVVALPDPDDAPALFDGDPGTAHRATGAGGVRPVVRAMIDLGTWQALGEQGLGPAEAVDAVSRMLAA